VGYLPPRNQMEAHTDRYPPIDCKYIVDDLIHHILETLKVLEVNMDELKWELLTEVQGRLGAELLQTYFKAYGIDVELFQEAIGHHIYPVMIDGLGYVQLFVSKEQAGEAHKLLDEYNRAKE